MLLHVLKIIAIIVLAGGAFYGVYYLAKRRGLFTNDPVAPGAGKGPGGGTPAKPK